MDMVEKLVIAGMVAFAYLMVAKAVAVDRKLWRDVEGEVGFSQRHPKLTGLFWPIVIPLCLWSMLKCVWIDD